MPNHQKHRGQHSNDPKYFSPKQICILREAVEDLSFLYTRGYSEEASLELVGNHYQLHKRQRMALRRAACSKQSQDIRGQKVLMPEQMKDRAVAIDAYNLLITVESHLSGALLFLGKDFCYRDIASIHGTYRKVEETVPAIKLIGKSLADVGVACTHWYLDRPISNSARLKNLLLETAQEQAWHWEASLEYNPDKSLAACSEVVISSDRWILDRVQYWFNFMEYILLSPKAHSNIRILT